MERLLSRTPDEERGRLAALVRAASSVVALTGAGISVPSGIPDFRSPGTGIWQSVDPMTVAQIDVWRSDPARFWGFYAQRFALLEERVPNAAHRALAELERRGLLDAVVTQNIDRLHRHAGTRELVEVHGSIESSVCLSCSASFALAVVRERIAADEQGVPRCDCGAALKPGVVLFGELLPEPAIDRAFDLARGADLLLCIGTSLEVYPVAQLPGITAAAGGRVAIVSQGPTSFDEHASARLGGDVVDELEGLLAALA